jgi:hypothetical protein
MPQPLKVTCPSCSSKFHIPVHLVRGKVVSFRCKKCRGTIPVDGRAISSLTPQPMPAPSVPAPDFGDARSPVPSEPSMRLSLSDGLVVHEGMPSTAGLQVDTPAAFAHASAPQKPVVPGASRTPPWGLAPSTTTSAPPPPIYRTEPPEAPLRSEPPPSYRGGRGSRKIVAVLALAAAAALSLWSLRNRRPTNVVTAKPSVEANERPAAAPPQPAVEARPAADLRAPTPAPAAIEPAKVATPIDALPTAKANEPAKRGKAHAAKAPAPVEKTEPAPEVGPAAPEEAPATPPAGNAAAAQEATSQAVQEIEFNKEAARQALDDAGQRASACRTIDTPAGAARIAVTFAPAGNVTSAVVESGPFVGTAAGGCVASKFKTVRVPAFTGDPITVHKSISF